MSLLIQRAYTTVRMTPPPVVGRHNGIISWLVLIRIHLDITKITMY